MNRTDMMERGRDFLGAGRLRSAREHRRDEIILGIGAAIVVVIVTAVLGIVYLQPPGYLSYRAELSNSSGVRTGDQVRVAGISVGKVDDVRLAGDHVAVKFSVRRDIRMGDASSIAVKMLTPVGGRYLMVASKGGKPLGNSIIPKERVTGTYDLSSIIETATPKVEKLDGAKLRSVVVSARKTLTGDTGAIETILESAAKLSDELGQRSEQLQSAMKVSDEYLAATTKDRQVLMALIKSLADLGVGLGPRYDQVRRVFSDLGKFFFLINRVTTFYEVGFEKFVVEGAKILARLQPQVDAIGETLRNVDGVLERLRTSLTVEGVTVDQSGQRVRGARVCVPNAAKRC